MANVPISAFTVPANTVGLGATGYSLTGSASASFVDLSGTWNTTGTPTAIELNITDTASNAASLLMDLQVGGSSRLSVSKTGAILGPNTSFEMRPFATNSFEVWLNNQRQFQLNVSQLALKIASGFAVAWNSQAADVNNPSDTFLSRRAAANLRFGAADAAAPVAQTLSVQSVVAGTSNTAGANLTITGSQGTGSGVGGSIVFQVAPAGGSGTAQNALANILTLGWTGSSGFVSTFTGVVALGNLQISSNTLQNLGGVALALNPLGNNVGVGLSNPSQGLTVKSTYGIAWDNGGGTADTILARDGAANTLALRNGAAAQRFNVYNTWTSPTNYEAFKIDWITTANTVLVGTEKGSGGGTARALAFQTDGTTRLTIASSSGDVTTTGSVTTAAPAGGTAAAWKLGTVATVTPTLQNRTIEVDIGGTIYYISAKTTND